MVMTVLFAGLLYGATRTFIAVANSYGSITGLMAAATLALAVVTSLEFRLARRARVGEAVAVNAFVSVLFAVFVTADGLLFHPGLAKDVERSFSGVLGHLVRLLALGVPVLSIGLGLYLLADKVSGNHAGVRRS